MGRKSGPSVSDREAQEPHVPEAPKKAKKAAERSIAREAKAKGQSKQPEGWLDGIQKGEYGQDIFDGEVDAKWPALFKKHLEYLESHIKALDSVMQGMQSDMKNMREEQRREFELGGDSKWRTICGLVDRARETLVAARFASHTIIPASWQKDTAGLGVTGFKFERLLPKLRKKAEAEGFSWGENKLDSLWGIPPRKAAASSDSALELNSEEGDTDDESESNISDSEEPTSEEEEEGKQSTMARLAKPMFFVDSHPILVNTDGSAPKKGTREKKSKKNKNPEPESAEAISARKSKKRTSEELEESSSVKKSKVSQPERANVDFTAVETQLQAEVEAALRAKEQELNDQARKREKKRKRSSAEMQAVVNLFKKKQRLELREKTKTIESGVSDDSPAKERKNNRKRKAENGEHEGKSKKARG